MKNIILYFVFAILMSGRAFSQDTITIYYDDNWEEISARDEAVYYRKAFRDSSKTWMVRDYYMSDSIQMTGSFLSEELKNKHGHFVYYYESGQKSSEGDYVKNKRNGEWIYWYENGNIRSINHLRKGVLNSGEAFFENGNKWYSGQFVNGKKNGVWTFWNEDGRMVSKGKFKNDLREGEWIRYFPEGEMKLFFVNGILESKQPGGIVKNKIEEY